MPTEPTLTAPSCRPTRPPDFLTETAPNSSPHSGKSPWDQLHLLLAVRLALQLVQHNRDLQSLAKSFLGDLLDPRHAPKSQSQQDCLLAPGLDPKFWELTRVGARTH